MQKLALILGLMLSAPCIVAAGAAFDDCSGSSGEACSRSVTWAGSLRLRFETWDNFAFLPDADDTFLLGRILLQADARLNENISFFVQGKSALSTDRNLPGGTRTLDVDTLALAQGYLDLRLGSGSADSHLLVGRQALQFGQQRLVSPLPWGNTLRAWDGARYRLKSGKWRIDGFYSWYVPVQKYDINRRETDEPFYGLHATFLARPASGFDGYWLHRERPNVSFNGTSGAERRDTFGIRLFHQSGRWRGDLEITRQTGKLGAESIAASMAALELGRFWDDGRLESAVFGLDYASGDRSPGGRVETFDQQYPLGHAFLGYIDFIGRQNIVSGFLRSRLRLSEIITVELTGLTFARARSADALYNPGGGALRPAGQSAARHVGEEIDVVLSRPLGAEGRLLLGYSHFFPGSFVNNTGSSAATNFAYAQYLLTF